MLRPHPAILWLATGGKSQLSQDKLSILAGRRTIAFPDIDGYEEWKRKLLAIDLNITVSDILQRSATDEQRAAHIDIADLIIQWKQDGEPLHSPPALNVRTHLQRLDQDRHLQETRLRNLQKTL